MTIRVEISDTGTIQVREDGSNRYIAEFSYGEAVDFLSVLPAAIVDVKGKEIEIATNHLKRAEERVKDFRDNLARLSQGVPT